MRATKKKCNPEGNQSRLAAMATREGGVFKLKCRTFEEASLVCEELEKSDILVALPKDEDLEAQFKQQGYVEIQVSAKAYAALRDLRSEVEFQFKQARAEMGLSALEKLLGLASGLLLPFGLLNFFPAFE